MKPELIKEFEEKHQRSRFLQDTGIGDMHGEQGCYCDEYVEFLEQKLANGAEQSTSNCNIPLVSNSLLSLDGKTIPVTFHVSKFEPKIDIDLSNDC